MDRLNEALGIWARWKRFGLPFAGGWAEQPAVVLDVIEAIEEVARG